MKTGKSLHLTKRRRAWGRLYVWKISREYVGNTLGMWIPCGLPHIFPWIREGCWDWSPIQTAALVLGRISPNLCKSYATSGAIYLQRIFTTNLENILANPYDSL